MIYFKRKILNIHVLVWYIVKSKLNLFRKLVYVSLSPCLKPFHLMELLCGFVFFMIGSLWGILCEGLIGILNRNFIIQCHYRPDLLFISNTQFIRVSIWYYIHVKVLDIEQILRECILECFDIRCIIKLSSCHDSNILCFCKYVVRIVIERRKSYEIYKRNYMEFIENDGFDDEIMICNIYYLD